MSVVAAVERTAPSAERHDRWWIQPLEVVVVLTLFSIYALWAALHGQISTPFAVAPEGWSAVRAIVCGAYWWCVYIFTTRF